MGAGTPWRVASALMVCRQDWKSFCAKAGPARNAVVAARSVVLRRGFMPSTISRPGDGHALDSHRRCIGRTLELKIVGRSHVQEHVLQVPGHGDAAPRPAELAVLNPEARGAAAVVAGHAVDTEADHVGDVEPALDVAQKLVERELALLEVEVREGQADRKSTRLHSSHT